jgi:mannosyltransferase OCH1-like enzyme
MSIYINLLIILIIFLVICTLTYLFFNKNNDSYGNNDHGYDHGYGYGDNVTIPKIIIQTWKTNDIPEKYANDIDSVKKLNPDFTYMFFTDDDIDKFISNNYPEYYTTFKNLPTIIQKIDYFRYIAVYHYGGFYFDLDITGLYPLHELLNYECIFPVDTIITDTYCTYSRFKKYCEINMPSRILLGQYAFGAIPKHPFIKKLIDTINDNCDKYIEQYKSEYGKTLEYVYSSTGPDFVTNVFIQYNNKDTITILNYDKEQYFGKYAKHNYFGTWK